MSQKTSQKTKHMKKTFFSLLWAGVMTLAALVPAQAQISDSTVATFENLTLEAESYYLGDDSVGFKEFRSGDFIFSNTYTYDSTYKFGYWRGFGYANLTSSLYDTAASASYDLNTFRCAAGAGAEESATYALAYASVFDPAVVRTLDTTGQVIAGAYFVNNATAVNRALYGDAFGVKPFAQGDFMKIHCVGFLGQDSVGETDLYLIDYRSKNPNEHYILQAWKWFDLSVLGKVNRVEFVVMSSQKNQFGELFPQYFCVDDFGITGTSEPQEPTSNRFYQETLAVNLYPVPAREILTLDIDRNDYNVEIFQPSGRPVKTLRHLNGQTEISVADLTAGLYLLRITCGGVTRTLRFVKA